MSTLWHGILLFYYIYIGILEVSIMNTFESKQ